MFTTRSAALAIVLLPATLAGQEVAFPADSERVVLPLRHLDRGQPGWLIGVDVEMAGDTRVFVLDTGAGQHVIHPDTADRLGLEQVGLIRVMHPHEEEMNQIVALPPLAVGGLTMTEHYALRLDVDHRLGTHTRPVGGLLGMPFFAQHPVTIDMDRGEVIVHEPESFTPPDAAHALKCKIYGFSLVVEASIGDSEPVDLMVDTGAGLGIILFPHCVEQLGLLDDNPDLVSDSTGTTGRLFYAELPRASVGSLAFDNIPVGLHSSHEGNAGFTADKTYSGILGSALLWRYRVTFDHAHKRIYLEERTRAPGGWSRDFGIVLAPRKGRVVLSRVIDGSLADRAGLERHDVVTRIDDLIVGRNITGANRHLRNASRIELAVEREGELITAELERQPTLVPLR